MNEALKTKWLWRFAYEDDALWKKVIVSKYGTDRLGWWSKKSPFCSRGRVLEFYPFHFGFFKSFVCFKVGNGPRVLFWQDKWCTDQPLKAQFPNLFRMASSREATVQEILSWNGSMHFWNITFTRSPNAWEEESILNLLSLLAELKVDIHLVGEDHIVWSLNSRGIFYVKSVCEKMLVFNCLISQLRKSGSQMHLRKLVSLLGRHPKARFPQRSCLKKGTLI